MTDVSDMSGNTLQRQMTVSMLPFTEIKMQHCIQKIPFSQYPSPISSMRSAKQSPPSKYGSASFEGRHSQTGGIIDPGSAQICLEERKGHRISNAAWDNRKGHLWNWKETHWSDIIVNQPGKSLLWGWGLMWTHTTNSTSRNMESQPWSINSHGKWWKSKR